MGEDARRKLDAEGLYGTRGQVLRGDLTSLLLPPYLASLVVTGNLQGFPFEGGSLSTERVYRCLRPYGGVACFPLSRREHGRFAQWVKEAALSGSQVTRMGGITYLRRPGALPGAADWTHSAGCAGNTYASADRAARPPFGLLWFGGSMHDVLRQRRFSAAVVSRGRMFMALKDELHAMDLFTGRHLWKKDVNANSIAAAGDDVYMVCEGVAHRLDAASGAALGQLQPPTQPLKQDQEH